jgi:hypothetical protein
MEDSAGHHGIADSEENTGCASEAGISDGTPRGFGFLHFHHFLPQWE